jgi:hypothetical protein
VDALVELVHRRPEYQCRRRAALRQVHDGTDLAQQRVMVDRLVRGRSMSLTYGGSIACVAIR